MTVHSIDDNNNEDNSINKASTLLLIPPSLGPTPDLGIETTHGVAYFVSACVQEAETTNKSYFCDVPAFVTLCPSYPAQLSSDTTAENINNNNDNKKIEIIVAVARRSGLLKRAKPHGTVQVLVTEPGVVDLDKSTGDVSGTVQLQLFYTVSKTASSPPPPPQITQVSTALIAITTDAHDIATTEALPLVEHPVLRPRWCPNTQTATIAVPVSVPFHTNALPTFASGLLTRRYEMRVTVTFKGATAAVLHVPVLLVASVMPRHYFGYLETWQRVAAQQRATDRAAPSLSKAALIELEAKDGADRAELACYQ